MLLLVSPLGHPPLKKKHKTSTLLFCDHRGGKKTDPVPPVKEFVQDWQNKGYTSEILC